MRSPPIAGPAIDEISNPLEFHDTAVLKISNVMMPGRNAARDGMMKDLDVPYRNRHAYRKKIEPPRVELMASPSAAVALNASAAMKTRFRLNESVMWPAISMKRICGAN